MVFLRTAGASLFLLFCALLPARGNATLVSGQVTDAATGYLLQGAIVQALESSPDPFFLQTAVTDGNGNYQIDVPPGSPQISVVLAPYIGQTQYLTLDSTPQTVNFPLGTVGSIAGTVHVASSGAPLTDNAVSLIDENLHYAVGQTYSADDGTYSFDGIGPGTYAVCVIDGSDVYLDVCYDAKILPADGTIVYTPVVLASNQELTGIDFSMQTGATLRGTLRDSYFNVPIADAQIDFTLYSPQHGLIATFSATTDDNGAYTVSGLAAGSYYLEAGVRFAGYNTNGQYTSRLYGGGECGPDPQCPFETATLINVPATGVTGIDFGLFPGYLISGKVTDAQTGLGIANVTINACDNPSGMLPDISATAVTDANGNYVIAHVVGAQTYVATINASAYLNLIWPNAVIYPSTSCLNALIYGGTALNFTSPDQTLTDVNFALQRGAAISGTITAREAPAASVSSKVSLYFNDGQSTQWVGTVDSDADGNYTSVGVAPGTYYVAAYYDDGFDCQLYSANSCGSNWTSTDPLSADFSSATPIVLTGTQIQGGIDLQLITTIFHDGFE